MNSIRKLASQGGFEKRCIDWLERHVCTLLLIAFAIAGIAMRMALLHVESMDYEEFLAPWYDEIKQAGGLSSLGTQVGNYNVLYQFLIACMTYIPISKLEAYKIVSCVGDVALAVFAGILASDTKSKGQSRPLNLERFTIAFGAVFLFPPVALNSAAWAQCDSLWAACCLLALVLLHRNRSVGAFLAYGLAVSFKLQAIFLVPYLLFEWFHNRSFSLRCFFAVPAVMLVTGIPAIMQGMPALNLFWNYVNQTDEFHYVALNYPTVWSFLALPESTIPLWGERWYDTIKTFAVAITFAALLFEMYVLHKKYRGRRLSGPVVLQVNALFMLTCIQLLPSMHDRYTYLADVFLLLSAIYDLRFLPSAAVALVVAMCTYGRYLFQAVPTNYLVLAGLLTANLLLVFLLVYTKKTDAAS